MVADMVMSGLSSRIRVRGVECGSGQCLTPSGGFEPNWRPVRASAVSGLNLTLQREFIEDLPHLDEQPAIESKEHHLLDLHCSPGWLDPPPLTSMCRAKSQGNGYKIVLGDEMSDAHREIGKSRPPLRHQGR